MKRAWEGRGRVGVRAPRYVFAAPNGRDIAVNYPGRSAFVPLGWVRGVTVAVCLTTLSACASTRGLRCGPGETLTVVESLYFGTHKPGGEVTAAEWQAFLADAVTPRFPDGLTVWAAAGQWRGTSEAIEREPSYVVQIAHPESADAERKVRAIVAEYERRFQQEAVMRVRGAMCVSF
jgi:hypothetical protein